MRSRSYPGIFWPESARRRCGAVRRAHGEDGGSDFSLDVKTLVAFFGREDAPEKLERMLARLCAALEFDVELLCHDRQAQLDERLANERNALVRACRAGLGYRGF